MSKSLLRCSMRITDPVYKKNNASENILFTKKKERKKKKKIIMKPKFSKSAKSSLIYNINMDILP